MADYPGTLPSFTTKTDKVDLVSAAHMNDVQSEVVAVATELGTDVAGDQTDLKTRLAISIANDGAMKNDTSFPGSPSNGDFFYKSDVDVAFIYNGTTWKSFSGALESGTSFPTGADLYDGLMFYKSDEDVLYVYNGATWDAQGISLSNVLFCWTGLDDHVDSSFDINGLFKGADLTPDQAACADNLHYEFLANVGTTAKTVLESKFLMPSGVQSITIYAKVWAGTTQAAEEATIIVNVGGQSDSLKTTTSATPTWLNNVGTEIDVSGLTPGTVYDITVQLDNEGASSVSYCSAIILFGS